MATTGEGPIFDADNHVCEALSIELSPDQLVPPVVLLGHVTGERVMSVFELAGRP